MSKDQLTVRDLDQSGYEGPVSIRPFVSEEGWEFHPGVPDGAEDGWFTEDLWAAAIPADGEGDGGYGPKKVHLTTHDGKVNIWIEDGDDSWSVDQVEQLANLLPDVLVRAQAYTPKPWMLDQTELSRMKQTAYGSCPVVLPEDSVSD
jgi:hypothetical protein